MKNFVKFLSIIMIFAACGSCVSTKTTSTPVPKVVNLALIGDVQQDKYLNMDYGIRLNVDDARSSTQLINKYDVSAISIPQVTVNPGVRSFVSESMRRYMRTMGFNMDADIATDYMMSATIKDFNLGYLSGIGWAASVSLEIKVYDADRKLVYPNTLAVGRASNTGSAYDFSYGSQAINKAYANALQDIDWDRIAYFLTKASSPKQEANKQVEGQGNTALESTVIRWFIDSTPKGADVYMRVISSTPEVHNTNQNYVGTTPYETTESFDIKGLTYNNSGNVQIEVSCEKGGYVVGKKRFNVKQAIDQKEISTKFTLIKEE